MPVRCQNEHNLSFLINFVQDSKVACLIRVLRTNITPDPHPDSGVIFTIVLHQLYETHLFTEYPTIYCSRFPVKDIAIR